MQRKLRITSFVLRCTFHVEWPTMTLRGLYWGASCHKGCISAGRNFICTLFMYGRATFTCAIIICVCFARFTIDYIKFALINSDPMTFARITSARTDSDLAAGDIFGSNLTVSFCATFLAHRIYVATYLVSTVRKPRCSEKGHTTHFSIYPYI